MDQKHIRREKAFDEVKELDLAPFRLLKRKAFALPHNEKEEQVYQADKDLYLRAIYGAPPNYEFKLEEGCPFKIQFAQLIEACAQFGEQHLEEIKAACAKLHDDYQLTPEKIKVLRGLTAKVNQNNYTGLDQGGVSEEQKEQDKIKFFNKLKIGLEDVLYSMVIKLKAQEQGEARNLILQRIAQAYVYFAAGFDVNVCTAGAQSAVNVQQAKWRVGSNTSAWLTRKRIDLALGFAQIYIQQHGVTEGWEAHILLHYQTVFHREGVGVPDDNVEQFIGSGTHAKTTVFAAAEKDLKEKFPQSYTFEVVCETVGKGLAEKYGAVLAKYGDKLLTEKELDDFKKEMAFLVDNFICRLEDLIETVEIHGKDEVRVNTNLAERLLSYCYEYSPLLLATEGYIDDVTEYTYLVEELKQQNPAVTGPKKHTHISLGKLIDLHRERKKDISQWCANSSGDTLLTESLRRGEIFRFMMLLRKKIKKDPQGDKSPLIDLLNPSAKNPRGDREGLTALALVILNPEKEKGVRYLHGWRQNIAVKLLLEHPAVTYEDFCQTLEGGNVYLRDYIVGDQFTADAFALFWDYLPQKARTYVQLKLGEQAAQRKATEAASAVVDGPLDQQALMKLGEEEMKTLGAAVVDARIATGLTTFANKVDKRGWSALMHVAKDKDANFQKIAKLMLSVMNLDFRNIPKIKSFADLTSPLAPKMDKVRKLLYLPMTINSGDMPNAKKLFLALAIDAKAPAEGVAAGPPPKNLQEYKKLLKIVFNQCNQNKKHISFIRKMMIEENDVRFRMALAEYAPKEVDLSTARRYVTADGKEEKLETPLRLTIINKDESQMKELLRLEADPTVTVAGESPFLLAARTVRDTTVQGRMIKMLLDSPLHKRDELLLQAAQADVTSNAFVCVLDYEVEQIQRNYGGKYRKQLGLARFAFIQKEKQAIMVKWQELHGAVAAPALLPQTLEQILNPGWDAKEICDGVGAAFDKEKLTQVIQFHRGQGVFRDRLHKVLQALSADDDAKSAGISEQEVEAETSRAIAVLGQRVFAEKVEQGVAQQIRYYADKEDSQGMTALCYAAQAYQFDKIKTLFLAVKNLKLDKLFAIKDILGVDDEREIKADRLSQDKQATKRLVQLMHVLKSEHPDYNKAKRLFLALTSVQAADSQQPANRNFAQYERLATMVVNQCQNYKEFFKVLVVDETNAQCVVAIYEHEPVDLTPMLPYAAQTDCDIEVFLKICEAVSQSVDQPSDTEQKGPASASVVDFPALVTQLTTSLKDQQQVHQYAKFRTLLSYFKLVPEPLFAAYPRQQTTLDNSRDVLMEILLALHGGRLEDAAVYVKIYMGDHEQKPATIAELDWLKYKTAARETEIYQELLRMVSVQFDDATCQALQSQLDPKTPKGLLLVNDSIVKESHAQAKQQLLTLCGEEKELAKVKVDRLTRHLDLLFRVHFSGSQPPLVFDEKIKAFCSSLLADFKEIPDVQIAILLHIFRFDAQAAATLFYQFISKPNDTLLTEAALIEALDFCKEKMRALLIADSAEKIKAFLGAVFKILIQDENFCDYDKYPILLGQSFEEIGYNTPIFAVVGKAVRQPPLCYFLRQKKYAMVETFLRLAQAGKPIDLNQADGEGITALMLAVGIEDEVVRDQLIKQFLLCSAAEGVRAQPAVIEQRVEPVVERKDREVKQPERREAKVEVFNDDAQGNEQQAGLRRQYRGLMGDGMAANAKVAQGVAVDTVDERKRNVLLRALDNGYPDTAIILIQQAAQLLAKERDRLAIFVKQADQFGRTAVTLAMEKGFDEVVFCLLEHAPINWVDISETKEDAPNVLNINNVRKLLASAQGDSGLTMASFTNGLPKPIATSEQIVKLLKIISQQCLTAQYIQLFTELFQHYVKNPWDQVADILGALISGAPQMKVGIISSRGFPVLPFAVYHANMDLLKLALARNVDIEQKTKGDETALLLAVYNSALVGEKEKILTEAQQEQVVTLLLEHKADINTKDNWGTTVFASAVDERCSFPTFVVLLAHDQQKKLTTVEVVGDLTTKAQESAVANQKLAVCNVIHWFTQSAYVDNPQWNGFLSSFHALVTTGVSDEKPLFDDKFLLRLFNMIKQKLSGPQYQNFIKNYLSTARLAELNTLRKSLLLGLLTAQYRDICFDSGTGISMDPPVHYMIRSGHYVNALMLLQASGSATNLAQSENRSSETPLMILAQQHDGYSLDKKTLLIYLAPRSNFAAVSSDGMTVLMSYARYGQYHSDMFALIFAETQAFNAVNTRNSKGETAVGLACAGGGKAVMLALLEMKEVDKTIADNNGNLPIEVVRGRQQEWGVEECDRIVACFFAVDFEHRIKNSLIAKYKQRGSDSPLSTKILAAQAFYLLHADAVPSLADMPADDPEFYQLLLQYYFKVKHITQTKWEAGQIPEGLTYADFFSREDRYRYRVEILSRSGQINDPLLGGVTALTCAMRLARNKPLMAALLDAKNTRPSLLEYTSIQEEKELSDLHVPAFVRYHSGEVLATDAVQRSMAQRIAAFYREHNDSKQLIGLLQQLKASWHTQREGYEKVCAMLLKHHLLPALLDAANVPCLLFLLIEAQQTAAPLPVSGDDHSGDPVWCWAVRHKRNDLIDALCEAKVNPNTKNAQGKSALYLAVEQKELETVKRLVALPRIDKEAYCATTGMTAGMLAYQSKQKEISDLFGLPDQAYAIELQMQTDLESKTSGVAAAAEKFKALYELVGDDTYLNACLQRMAQRYGNQYAELCANIATLIFLPALTVGRLDFLTFVVDDAKSAHPSLKAQLQAAPPLSADRLAAMYPDTQLKPFWPTAALVFAQDFARRTPPSQELLPVARQLMKNALIWPENIEAFDGGILITLLDCIVTGLMRYDSVVQQDLALLMTSCLQQAVADKRADTAHWLLVRGSVAINPPGASAAAPERKREVRGDEAGVDGAARSARLIAPAPVPVTLLDVNVNAQGETQPIIFVVLRYIATDTAKAGRPASPWQGIAVQIMDFPSWHHSYIDSQGATVLTRALGAPVATFQQILQKNISLDEKTNGAKILVTLDSHKKSVMDYALLYYDEKEPTKNTKLHTDALLEVCQGLLQTYRRRIEFCQQFSSLAALQQKIAELNQAQAKIKNEQMAAQTQVPVAMPAVAGVDEAKTKSKTAEEKRQDRLKTRLAAVGKELDVFEKGLQHYSQLTVMGGWALEISIEIMKFHCYQKQKEGHGATSMSHLLLTLLQEVTAENLTQLQRHYKLLIKSPEFLVLYELLFRYLVINKSPLVVLFIQQDLRFPETVTGAVQKFMLLYHTISHEGEVRRLVEITGDINANAEVKPQCADFCMRVLNVIGVNALQTQRLSLLVELVGGTKLLEPKLSEGIAFLQQTLSDTEILFAPDVLMAVSGEETLRPLWPWVALSFAQSFNKGAPHSKDHLLWAEQILLFVLNRREGINTFASGVVLRVLNQIHAGIVETLYHHPDPAFVASLKEKMTSVFRKAAINGAADKVNWLLANSNIGTSPQNNGIGVGVGGVGLFPAGLLPIQRLPARQLPAHSPARQVSTFDLIEVTEDEKGQPLISAVLEKMAVTPQYDTDIFLHLLRFLVLRPDEEAKALGILSKALACDDRIFKAVLEKMPSKALIAVGETKRTLMDDALVQSRTQHASLINDVLLVELKTCYQELKQNGQGQLAQLATAQELAIELLKFAVYVSQPTMALAPAFSSGFVANLAAKAKAEQYKIAQAMLLALQHPTEPNIRALDPHKAVIKKIPGFQEIYEVLQKLPRQQLPPAHQAAAHGQPQRVRKL